MKRTASAEWREDLMTGAGTVSTASGLLAANRYSFRTRFRDTPGTNPEELLATASIHTTCAISLEKQGEGFAITESHLNREARVPGARQEAFDHAVQAAKTGCPVPKLYHTNITLTSKLLA